MAGCTSAPPPPSSALPAVVGWSRAEIEQSSDVVSLPSGPPPVFCSPCHPSSSTALAARGDRSGHVARGRWRVGGGRGDLARRSTYGAMAAGPAGDTARRDPDRRRDRGRARRGRRGVERRGGGMGERRRGSLVATEHRAGRGWCDRIAHPRRGGHARRLRRGGLCERGDAPAAALLALSRRPAVDAGRGSGDGPATRRSPSADRPASWPSAAERRPSMAHRPRPGPRPMAWTGSAPRRTRRSTTGSCRR